MSKRRWVTCILEMLSFFLEWRFPDSGVVLIGVLVSGTLALGGSPSLARLIVGMSGLNMAQWELARGIPSGRQVRHVSLATSFSWVGNETATFCGLSNLTIPVLGLPEPLAPGAVSGCPTGVLWGVTGSKE